MADRTPASALVGIVAPGRRVLAAGLAALHLRNEDARFGGDLDHLASGSPYLVCHGDEVLYGQGIEQPVVIQDVVLRSKRTVRDTGGFNFPSGQQLVGNDFAVVGGTGGYDIVDLRDGLRIASPWNRSFIPMAMEAEGRVYGLQARPPQVDWIMRGGWLVVPTQKAVEAVPGVVAFRDPALGRCAAMGSRSFPGGLGYGVDAALLEQVANGGGLVGSIEAKMGFRRPEDAP